MAVTAKGTPYVESSDLVANYPGVSLALANHIDTIGKVLQVVSATFSTSTFTTSTSYVTTGLTATITPKATSSKIMAIANTRGASNATGVVVLYSLFRGTAAGTQIGSEINIFTSAGGAVSAAGIAIAYDSPATAAAQVYTLCMKVSSGTGTAQNVNSPAVIILMEIGA